MRRSRAAAALAAVLALAPSASFAQSVKVLPAQPGTADLVTLEGDVGAPRCPVLARDGLSMSSNLIRVELGEALDCAAAPFSRFQVTLGRFPAGEYRIVVVERNPHTAGIGVTMVRDALFSVSPYGTSLRENMTGHWTTNVAGEGVSITQMGARIFFTWLAYGPDGRATWLVVPDAAWQAPGAKAGRFAGTLYTARGAAPKGVAGVPFTAFSDIASSGSAAVIEVGPDAATLELRFDDGREVTRALKRMRF